MVVLEGKVLLVRRGKEPLRGRWLVPGGTVELGETLEEAIVREVLEETGVRVKPVEVLKVLDHIRREEGRVRYHYVIVDYLCAYVSGTPRAASDAEAVALVGEDELEAYDVPAEAREVVAEGLRRAGEKEACVSPPARVRSLK